ncbi:MAG: hypothetical protein ACK56I_12550, partial [bacterium]
NKPWAIPCLGSSCSGERRLDGATDPQHQQQQSQLKSGHDHRDRCGMPCLSHACQDKRPTPTGDQNRRGGDPMNNDQGPSPMVQSSGEQLTGDPGKKRSHRAIFAIGHD